MNADNEMDEIIDSEIYEEVESPKYCAKCSKMFSSFTQEYRFFIDGSEVCLCKKCFRGTWADWVSKPPVQRPDGWWKKIVDPQLKGWNKVKGKFFAPIMRNGPCDSCGKEETLYYIKFPNGRQTTFGLNRCEKRYFCKSCITAFWKYLQS